MIRCSKCGGTKVEVAMWVDPNTLEVREDFGSWDEEDTKWCGDCETNIALVADPVKDSKEG